MQSKKKERTANINGTESKPRVFTGRQWIVLALIGLALAIAVRALDQGLFSKPNVLLITIDTLRADRLGCYGYSRNTSPNLDRIAREGWLFERCYASSSWTLPSVMSIHTGLYPFSHGVQWVDRRLSPGVPTLAEMLKDRGYRTGAVESSLFLGRAFGFDRGFDQFQDKPIHDHRAISSPLLTDRALEWLRAPTEQPFFYWIHYLDPHYDYLHHRQSKHLVEGVPPAELEKEYSILELKKTTYSLTDEQYAWQSQIYDGEVFFTDQHIGRLIQHLEQSGRWDDTWIVVTSDHGELLGEHGGLGHTPWFYDPVLRVPLIIKPPKRVWKSNRISDLVSIVDIVPTLLEGLGIRYDQESFDGINLLKSRDRLELPTRWACTKTEEVEFIVRLGTSKYILDTKSDRAFVFDTSQDPGENENRLEQQRGPFQEFKQQVQQLIPAQDREAQETQVDTELLDRMKAHGYLGGGGN